MRGDYRSTLTLSLCVAALCRATSLYAQPPEPIDYEAARLERAIAIGGAFSFLKFVKVGAGYAWTRHVALDGQDPGQGMADANALRTREIYGDPRFYWSISLIGWAPFQKE
mgnify:CR=1 FL=1